MPEDRDPCSVVNADCEAPAGFMVGGEIIGEPGEAAFECMACGEPVCAACSVEQPDGRACDYCAEEQGLVPVQEACERPPEHKGGMRVVARKCKTCVFGPNSPIGAERRRELEQEWRSRDTNQVCHYSGVWSSGDDADEDDERRGWALSPDPDADDRATAAVVCAGFFEERFLTEGMGQMLRIGARLGGFEYVEPKTLYEQAPGWEPLPDGAE